MTRAPSTVCVEAPRLRPSRWAAEYYRKEYTDLEDYLENSGLKLVDLGKLGRLFTGPFGSKLPASLYDTPNGVPLLRVQNIGHLFLNENDLARIPMNIHEELHRSKLEPGDLALAKAGRLGALSRIPEHIPECNITQHIVGVKISRERIRRSYLAAFFLTRFGKFQLKRQGIGTLIKYLGIEETRAAKVVLPDRYIQDYIGAKIELAERCRTKAFEAWCEASCQLSQTMGVLMNEETFVPKNPQDVSAPGYSVASVSPAIAQVSNTRIQGYIGAQFFHPRRAKAHIIIEQSGLETKRLSELANRLAERIPAADFYEHGYPYIGLANIDSTFGFIDGEGSDDISGTCALFRAGDILFSKLRPYLNKVTICPEHVPQACGSTELVVYRVKKGIDPYFLFFILKSPLVLNQVINITSGSTHPRVDPELIDDVLIPIPEKALQYSLGEKTRKTLKLLYVASKLVDEAKSDVQSLIEGTLDTDSIITGKLKPISQKDISDILNKEILQ